MRPRWGAYSLGQGEAQLRTRVTRFGLALEGYQNHLGQVTSRWGPESPCQGEAQRVPESSFPGEAQVGISLTRYMGDPGGNQCHHPAVAQVKTRGNRSRWVPVKEQCNPVLMLPRWVPEKPGSGEAQMGTRDMKSS